MNRKTPWIITVKTDRFGTVKVHAAEWFGELERPTIRRRRAKPYVEPVPKPPKPPKAVKPPKLSQVELDALEEAREMALFEAELDELERLEQRDK